MSHHQQMLKSSTAAFTYLYIFYHYSMAQSPEIFSAFLPWTFCTPDEPFFKPLKYPDNETEIKPTSGALWPHSRQTLLLTRAWDAAGSSPCSFAGARGAAHTVPALCTRATAAANILWHPWLDIPQWFQVWLWEGGAAVSPELGTCETPPGWYWNLGIEANCAPGITSC